jgi:hypothetical protein
MLAGQSRGMQVLYLSVGMRSLLTQSGVPDLRDNEQHSKFIAQVLVQDLCRKIINIEKAKTLPFMF